MFEGNDEDTPSLLPSALEHFPPPGLADTLINLYFLHTNLMFPLLHRPTFERQWGEGLYHRNEWFTCLCLLLFAVASRWCDDERVLPEEDRGKREDGDKPRSWINAGRKYFEVGDGMSILVECVAPENRVQNYIASGEVLCSLPHYSRCKHFPRVPFLSSSTI